MFDKLEDLLIRFEEIMGELNEPTVTNNQERFRKLIAAEPEKFVSLVKQVEKDTGILLEGDEYSRKKPCPVPILEPYYNLKNLKMHVGGEPGDLMFSPDLGPKVIGTLKKLYPMYEYCLRFSID